MNKERGVETMAGEQPLSQSEILQKLECVGNLESVVTEQRMRIEKLKTTYEILKAEHIQLQDGTEHGERALVEAREEMKRMQQQCQELITKARTERDSKIQECEELRSQVLTPQKMEILRMRLQSEIDLPYRKRLETLENELQKSRSDFNKLRYDYSFLKSEYEHEHSQYQRITEEIKGQYETQISNLQRERDFLIKKQEEVNDSQRVRTLQRENTQLNLKVKSLLNELEELREKREAAGLQSDHVSKLQARQLAELTAQCKALESEKESLNAQCQRLHTEKESNEKQQDQLITQVHELEKECTSLKSQLEDVDHKHKVELTNVKMELTKNRGDLEREREGLKVECDGLRNNISVLENTVEHLNTVISEKEQAICKREKAAKEKEWEKINILEQNNLQMEAAIAELERTKGDAQIAHHQEIKKLEEELRSMNEIKEILEQEMYSVRSQLKQTTDRSEELEKEKTKTHELKQKLQHMQTQLQSVLNSEQQLMAANERLKNTVDLLNEEIGIARSDLQRIQDENEKEIDQLKKSLQSEKGSMETEYNEMRKKVLEEANAAKKRTEVVNKKKQKYKRDIVDMKESMKLLKAKEEMARAEKEAVRKNMEVENQRLKKQFERLKKRQVHFKNMLNNTDTTVFPQAMMTVTSTPLPFRGDPYDQDQQRREISSVRVRLDDLADNQQRQADNLLGMSDLTATTSLYDNK